tara:strand:- start:211 stop:417 length:207 start_codon:yes stop_codon:yes gene_type:complete
LLVVVAVLLVMLLATLTAVVLVVEIVVKLVILLQVVEVEHKMVVDNIETMVVETALPQVPKVTAVVLS